MTIIYTDLQSFALIYRVVVVVVDFLCCCCYRCRRRTHSFSQTQIADKHGHELRSETSEQQFHTKHEKSNQSGLNGDFFFHCMLCSFFFFICSVRSVCPSYYTLCVRALILSPSFFYFCFLLSRSIAQSFWCLSVCILCVLSLL